MTPSLGVFGVSGNVYKVRGRAAGKQEGRKGKQAGRQTSRQSSMEQCVRLYSTLAWDWGDTEGKTNFWERKYLRLQG